MREIKFRGKCVDTGEWVYGYYLVTGPFYHDLKKHVIAIPGKVCDYAGLKFVDVIPESVGQFTGKHSKNGQEIYEKDIIEYDGMIFEVYFEDGSFLIDRAYPFGVQDYCKIIGNIHENPKLLEARP